MFFPQPVSFLCSSIPSWLECVSAEPRLRNPSGCDCLQLGWWGGPSLHLHHLLSPLLQRIGPPPRSPDPVPLPLLAGGIGAAPGRLWSTLCYALLSSKAVPSPLWTESLAFRTRCPAHKSSPLDSELNLHPTHFLFYLEAQKDIVQAPINTGPLQITLQNFSCPWANLLLVSDFILV